MLNGLLYLWLQTLPVSYYPLSKGNFPILNLWLEKLCPSSIKTCWIASDMAAYSQKSGLWGQEWHEHSQRQHGFKIFQAPLRSFQGLSLQSSKLKRRSPPPFFFSSFLGLWISRFKDICCSLFFFFWSFVFSAAAPVAYGGSQARDQIGAVATSLCHSHSNTGSEPRLWSTSQLMATRDP